MYIVPFEPSHLGSISLQKAQRWIGPTAHPDYGKQLKAAGHCYTMMDGDRVVACAGLVNMWENRAHAWAMISGDAGSRFVRMFRAMRSFLDMQETRRIEASVDVDFEQGHRLMRMLGFNREGLMKAYMPDGRDAVLYGRIR